MSRETSRRAVQALETRRVILDAARLLFTTQGYGATSVGQIAEAAGVALPTVYASVGTKATLLRLLLDRIDEQAGIAELAARLVAADDAGAVLDLGIRITRQLAERCGDLLAALQSAAGVEPEMAETFSAGMARHRAGARATVERLAHLGGLQADVSAEQATGMLATLTAPTVYASLTGEFGWSFDQCEDWLRALLGAQLLEPDRSA
jgi:AcrR family transcriptional regulator